MIPHQTDADRPKSSHTSVKKKNAMGKSAKEKKKNKLKLYRNNKLDKKLLSKMSRENLVRIIELMGPSSSDIFEEDLEGGTETDEETQIQDVSQKYSLSKLLFDDTEGNDHSKFLDGVEDLNDPRMLNNQKKEILHSKENVERIRILERRIRRYRGLNQKPIQKWQEEIDILKLNLD